MEDNVAAVCDLKSTRNVLLCNLSLDDDLLEKCRSFDIECYHGLKEKVSQGLPEGFSQSELDVVDESWEEFTRASKGRDEESGLEVLRRLSVAPRIPLMCDPINAALGGGFQQGLIYEIVGLPGSGKTQFCLSLLASHAISCSNSPAYFIDTEFTFYPRRFTQIVSQLKNGHQKEDFQELLRNVDIFRTGYYEDMFKILESLLDENSDLLLPSLIIIDSIAAPFRTSDFDTSYERLDIIKRLSYLLMNLSNQNVCIVLTNHITTKLIGEADSSVNGHFYVPSFGEFWSNFPNVRIVLSQDGEIRRFSFFKSFRCFESVTPFKITSAGIEKAC